MLQRNHLQTRFWPFFLACSLALSFSCLHSCNCSQNSPKDGGVDSTTPDAGRKEKPSEPKASPETNKEQSKDAGSPDKVTSPDKETSPDKVSPPDGSKKYGMSKRVINTKCKLSGKPPTLTSMTLEKAFPSLKSFSRPLFLAYPKDKTNRLFILEQGGRIYLFKNQGNVSSRKLFLDLSQQIRWPCNGCSNRGGNEEGLLGFAFHPNYKQNGYFYVYYTNNYKTTSSRKSIIARFKVSKNDPDKADPTSKTILLEVPQPYSNHNGGMLAFGPKGKLYISLGDGGSGGDPQGNGQNLKTLLSSILRIDVDKKDPGKQYAIPKDNPFVNRGGGVKKEIWAYGLRNTWRFSFDRAFGTLWAGDVGQNALEEIDIIVKGGNYGWNTMEGNSCYKPSVGCNKSGLIRPIIQHGRAEARSITGGYVYRGTKHKSLYGAYVYGDYVTGLMWALRYDGKKVTKHKLLARTGKYLASFGEDQTGELYVISFDGYIYKLKPSTPSQNNFPQTLSQTGCFQSLKDLKAAAGVIPFNLNSPLWSDGLDKKRWFALPSNSQIGWKLKDTWDFPDGAITIKHFSYNTTKGDPKTKHNVETRFMIKTSGKWFGYTYVWNKEQTDAYLVTGRAYQEINQKTSQSPIKFTHTIPSRADCIECHTDTAGGPLGLSTRQLNRDFLYGNGVKDNQLRAMNYIKLFKPALPTTHDKIERFAGINQSSATLEKRVRSYMHSNCSGCHRPGVRIPTTLDLRYDTPLKQTDTCNVSPKIGTLGVSGAKIIVPGAPDKSTLYLRMNRRGVFQMPRIGSVKIDKQGTSAIRTWIMGLKKCP